MYGRRRTRTRHSEPHPSKTKFVFKTIVLGLLVHILVIMATLEMNFSSPIDDGILPIEDISPPISNRIVLFVADGLRAQTIYNTTENITPFLNYIRASKGCWGVSLTRVPTESRPGHVAMLAGIYEDPSAVFKGWKSNPVNFDHILLQTKNAWVWGSPDIVSIFTREGQSHIIPFMYDSSMQDFGQRNTSILDTWVFNKFNEFLEEYKKSRKIKEPKSIFFLHLLGIDTAGHGFKPRSREYVENIKIVDRGIAQIVEKFDNIFNDNATTYVFTSDHGMTDWGSHGSGSDVETHTPFIAWGAGIRKSDTAFALNQIDIAPLMSNLLGIHIPVNSLGITPYKCLDISNENLKKIMIKNIQQFVRIYELKFSRIKSRKLRHEISDEKLISIKGKIDYLLKYNVTDNQDLPGFVNDSLDTMRLLLEGIDHYHNYYKPIISTFVTFGFLLWLIHLLIMTVGWDDVLRCTTRKDDVKTMHILFSILVFCSLEMGFICFAGYPWTYIIYMMFPVLMFAALMLESRRYMTFLVIFFFYFKRKTGHSISTCIMWVINIYLLIMGFKIDRLSFSFLLFLQRCWLQMSPKFSVYTGIDADYMYFFEKSCWIFMNILLGLFPLIPLWITSHQYYCFVGGFFVWSIVNFNLSKNIHNDFPLTKFVSFSYKVQLYFFTLSFIFIQFVDNEFISSTSSWKLFSWILSGVPMLFIPFVPCFQLMRLTAIVFGFASYYTLMSSGLEIMFMAIYVTVLFMWLRIESRNNMNVFKSLIVENVHFRRLPVLEDDPSISTDNIRIASQYICFLMIGFFFSGNAANLNFFDPMWTRCFVTVFSPFTMTTLIILKIIIPFILVTCFFRGVIIMGRLNSSAIFSYIIFIADCCFLNFMFSIKNVGSWLDIGMSISHFVIMGVFIIVILLLYGTAYLLTTVYIHESFIRSILKYLNIFNFFKYQNYCFLDDVDDHYDDLTHLE